jgi:hypothetical protein
MKASKLLAVVTLLLGLQCSAQTESDASVSQNGSLEPGYTITVAPPAGPIRLGSSIKIDITVKNVSGGDIYWRSYRPDTAYRAFRFMLKKDGPEVETTFLHRMITNRLRQNDPSIGTAGSSIVSSVPPGAAFVINVDLKQLYEITEAGQYTLDISRIEEDNKTIVHANTMVLKVEP